MIAALRPRYTFAEYLAVERLSRDVRHEYVNGEIFAMAGGTVEHSALSSAFLGLLFGQLQGTACRPHAGDLQISIRAAGVATYADVAVVCDPVERDPDSPSHVTNPRLVVEVLSPTTERYDREQKRLYYQQLESMQDYVLVAQDRRRLEIWTRSEGDWSFRTYQGREVATFTSIGCAIEVDSLYDAAGVSGQ